jgi:hypothetical protein
MIVAPAEEIVREASSSGVAERDGPPDGFSRPTEKYCRSKATELRSKASGLGDSLERDQSYIIHSLAPRS